MIVVNETTNDVDLGRLKRLEDMSRLTSQVNDTIFTKHFSIRLLSYVYLQQILNFISHL